MADKSELRIGDRVQVHCPNLAHLRQVMRDAAGQEPPPNHHGTVAELWDDDVLINFDADDASPWPYGQVERLIEPQTYRVEIPPLVGVVESLLDQGIDFRLSLRLTSEQLEQARSIPRQMLVDGRIRSEDSDGSLWMFLNGDEYEVTPC